MKKQPVGGLGFFLKLRRDWFSNAIWEPDNLETM